MPINKYRQQILISWSTEEGHICLRSNTSLTKQNIWELLKALVLILLHQKQLSTSTTIEVYRQSPTSSSCLEQIIMPRLKLWNIHLRKILTTQTTLIHTRLLTKAMGLRTLWTIKAAQNGLKISLFPMFLLWVVWATTQIKGKTNFHQVKTWWDVRIQWITLFSWKKTLSKVWQTCRKSLTRLNFLIWNQPEEKQWAPIKNTILV